jgi:hypothetical protein
LHDGKKTLLPGRYYLGPWRQECNYCTACISKCKVILLQKGTFYFAERKINLHKRRLFFVYLAYKYA